MPFAAIPRIRYRLDDRRSVSAAGRVIQGSIFGRFRKLMTRSRVSLRRGANNLFIALADPVAVLKQFLLIALLRSGQVPGENESLAMGVAEKILTCVVLPKLRWRWLRPSETYRTGSETIGAQLCFWRLFHATWPNSSHCLVSG